MNEIVSQRSRSPIMTSKSCAGRLQVKYQVSDRRLLSSLVQRALLYGRCIERGPKLRSEVLLYTRIWWSELSGKSRAGRYDAVDCLTVECRDAIIGVSFPSLRFQLAVPASPPEWKLTDRPIYSIRPEAPASRAVFTPDAPSIDKDCLQMG